MADFGMVGCKGLGKVQSVHISEKMKEFTLFCKSAALYRPQQFPNDAHILLQ